MICGSCGATNRDGARFCDTCGTHLDAPSRREQRKVVTVLFCAEKLQRAFAQALPATS